MPDAPAPARRHGLPPVARGDARLLILGSLPGEASLAAGRYYAHPRNQFWTLVGAVIGVDLAALSYPDRLEALADARIALWDVIGSAWRRGSTDAAIRDPAANDLAALLARLPQLQTIAFNGGTAHRSGLRTLGDAAAGYRIVALPSSSPLHTIPIAAKLAAWLALRDGL